MTKRTTAKLVDFAERIGSTFAAGFIGVALVTGISDRTALYAALGAGAVSAGKYAVVQANAFLNTT